jgi:hypothetical protein
MTDVTPHREKLYDGQVHRASHHTDQDEGQE